VTGLPPADAIGHVPRAVPASAVGWSELLLFLGLLVLVLTPVARVAATVGLFAQRRDGLYVAITLFVLLLLGATVAVGVLS